jgi:hypothetical protein
MKKTFSIMALVFMGTLVVSAAAKQVTDTTASFEELMKLVPAHEVEASAELAKLDKPVFLFKTTAKDPYYIVHRPGSNVLEIVMFGYYPDKKGSHVYRVSKPAHIAELMPIRQTKLYIDGPVKIDEKFPGYREAYVARAFEDVLKAIKILPEHYYKGTPFVDQYRESMASKWVFNNAAEFSAFRSYLQPEFETADILAKNLPKPVLILEVENMATPLSEDDYAFLNSYFTLCDLTNPVVKAFFINQQEQIIKAIAKIKDAKQVKEGFVDACFRQVESMTNEFKVKEMAVAAITAVVTAITIDIAKGYVRDFGAHVKNKVHEGAVKPVLNRVNGAHNDHALRNLLMYGGGGLALGFVATGVATQVAG